MMRRMLDGLSRRGAAVRESGLPVPPDPMPRRRGTRPLKRWRYVGVYSNKVMLCVGEVRVGPLPQRFWAVAEPGRPLAERTTIGHGGVRIEGSRAQVETRDVRIDLRVEEDGGLESIHPSGRDGYVWTRKQAGVPASAEVRVGGRIYSLDCDAVVDDTAGYHQRHTSWTWSAGERNSERAVWVDGEPFEPPPVEFAADLSRLTFAGDDGAGLEFSEWSAREDSTNVLLIRSTYRQPFGTFTGSFPGGVQLAEGFGVMEVHDVHW
jgi:hypothetical protein